MQWTKLLTGRTILTSWTKALSQALTHLNDPLVGPAAPYADQGLSARTLSITETWKSWESHRLLTRVHLAVLQRTPGPLTLRKGITCQNLQGDAQAGWWVTSLFLSLHVILSSGYKPDLWKHVIPGMEHTPLKEGRMGESSSYRFWPLVLLTNSAASPGHLVWNVQPGQVLRVAATLTPKDQATKYNFYRKRSPPIQVPSKNVFLTLDFWGPHCGWGGHVKEIPSYSGPTHMPGIGIPAVGYMGSCFPLVCQDCHGGYHPREGNLNALKQYIKEEQFRTGFSQFIWFYHYWSKNLDCCTHYQ